MLVLGLKSSINIKRGNDKMSRESLYNMYIEGHTPAVSVDARYFRSSAAEDADR